NETVTYSFLATNTGNVTLTDVVLHDPMLGGEVTLDKTTLAPGEEAKGTASYKVTEADLDKSELVNIATVEGTPPGYDPENPDSPQKPTDEDKHTMKVEQPAKPVQKDEEPPEPTKKAEKPKDPALVDPPKAGEPKPTTQPKHAEKPSTGS